MFKITSDINIYSKTKRKSIYKIAGLEIQTEPNKNKQTARKCLISYQNPVLALESYDT